MAAMWEKMIVLLNQMLRIYQALLRLSRKKREILVAANPKELEQVTKQEELLIIEAGKLETMRQTLVSELAAALGLAPNQAVLSTLIEHADKQTANQLKQISETFASVTDEIVKLNAINERLIKQSLDYINFNINMLSQSTADPIYAPKGQTETARPGRSILDAKA